MILCELRRFEYLNYDYIHGWDRASVWSQLVQRSNKRVLHEAQLRVPGGEVRRVPGELKNSVVISLQDFTRLFAISNQLQFV